MDNVANIGTSTKEFTYIDLWTIEPIEKFYSISSIKLENLTYLGILCLRLNSPMQVEKFIPAVHSVKSLKFA